jgi:aldehyde:ferredoxin oxidoreductase
MSNGFWEKVLRVDLSEGAIRQEMVPEEIWKKFLGGAGLGAKILYDEVGAEVGALSPENRIIFGLGPYQSTQLTGAAKFSIVSKSPLTEIYADSSAGGDWGIELKRAGFDAIIIQGKSERPVYLSILNTKVEIRDARHLWGKDSFKTTDAIIKEFQGEKPSIACIGQAGENQVAIANIVIDKHSFAGRCGLGAVMGAKNLKAVVVKGNQEPLVHNKNELSIVTKEIAKNIYDATHEWITMHGTPIALVPLVEAGDTPIKYWSGDTWQEGASKIGAPYYTEALNAKPRACKFCVVACHRYINIEEPFEYAMEGAGPHYETLAMLGSCCLMDDLKAIAKAGDWCNRYGIDTISAGAFIAFLMECFEKGIITQEQIGGIQIHWGDPHVMMELIHQIGQKREVGELFCHGIVPAARKLGKDALEIAAHVKGLDLPGHDPRAFFSMAINYATGTRGGCHERGNPNDAGTIFLREAGLPEPKNIDRFQMENTELLAARFQDYGCLANSLALCKFMLYGGIGLTDMLDCLNMVTGWDWTMGEFLKTGERIFTLQRLVNVKYGITRKDDNLPKKVFEPAKEGPRAGKIPVPFEPVLDGYYELRGWDSNGIPKKEKLKELELL